MIRGKRTNGMHSPGGIRNHKRECGGRLKMAENSKPKLGGVFELFTCEDECGYAGRGKKIRDLPLADVRPFEGLTPGEVMGDLEELAEVGAPSLEGIAEDGD